MNILYLIAKFLPRGFKNHIHYLLWFIRGKPFPPPHIFKKQVVKYYQKKGNYKILVETGTYWGDMVNSQKNNFDYIVSIELDFNLYKKALNKFKKYSHIKILNGDSAKILNDICRELNRSAIFWLDGHYCGEGTSKGEKETPIFEELEAILNNNHNHTILIDDARCFIGKNDYPTIPALFQIIKKKERDYIIEVKNDIIRVIPKNIINSSSYP